MNTVSWCHYYFWLIFLEERFCAKLLILEPFNKRVDSFFLVPFRTHAFPAFHDRATHFITKLIGQLYLSWLSRSHLNLWLFLGNFNFVSLLLYEVQISFCCRCNLFCPSIFRLGLNYSSLGTQTFRYMSRVW